jgi:asparagine synthase (glutamine-hydrolysing)
MFRYVIVVGDSQSTPVARALEEIRREHANSPVKWRTAADRPGFYAAYVDGGAGADRAISLHDRSGVIFGQVFRSETDVTSPGSITSMSIAASDQILRSAGGALLSGYWGHYVAALYYPETRTARVLRAPASPLACFHLKAGTINVFFSWLADCVALRLTALSINWDSITTQVVGGDYLTHETAINEIESLECGESIECAPTGCIVHRLWDPHRLLQDRSLGDFCEATRAMRKAVEQSVHALSSNHEGILVRLSGGLDSSIVLGTLARSPIGRRLTAVNYYSRDCGDERPYARIMARSVDCRLVEYPRDDGLDLRRFQDCNLTARPVLDLSAPDVEARNATLARDLHATAIFDGELGDNVFGRRPGPGVLAECMRRNGIGRRFLSYTVAYAMLTQQSVWRALALMQRERTKVSSFSAARALRDRYGMEGANSLQLASAEAKKHYEGIAERFVHPWAKDVRPLGLDSHRLLFGLITVTSTAYHSPFATPDDPPRVSPLISQPVVETALRIPGYLHCTSGQDRAVARTAFADTLPATILYRGVGKGGPSLWARDVIEKNSEFLREFLLDGILVGRGLLARKKVEIALSSRITKSSVMLADIFAKLYIEAWIRAFAQVGAT